MSLRVGVCVRACRWDSATEGQPCNRMCGHITGFLTMMNVMDHTQGSASLRSDTPERRGEIQTMDA